MIPGVIASMTNPQIVVATGTTWVLNFIDEIYTLDGVPVDLSEIIDKPARVGASGLEILDNDADGTVSAIGNFLAKLLTMDWTIVIEWEEVAGGVGDVPLLLSMLEFDDFTNMFIYRDDYVRVADSGSVPPYVRDLHLAGTFGLGIHRIAVTRTENFLSASVDGRPFVADANDLPLALTHASFGGDPEDDSWAPFFIRSINLKPPVSGTALPALSGGSAIYGDFINNEFWVNGVQVSASEILADYNPVDRTVEGLNTNTNSPFTSSSTPKAIGAFFDAFEEMLANGGFTFEVEHLLNTKEALTNEYSTSGPILYLMSNADADLADDTIYAEVDGPPFISDYNDMPDIDVIDSPDRIYVIAGIQRTAYTIFDDEGGGIWRTSTTLNGIDGQSGTTTHSGGYFTLAAVDLFAVGSWSYSLFGARIRSFGLYPPKTPAEISVATEVNDWPIYVGADGYQIFGGATTAHVLTMPDHEIGDLLIAIVAIDGSQTMTIGVGTGWTIGEQIVSNSAVTAMWLWKIAEGTSTATDLLTVTSSGSTKSSYTTFAYRGVYAVEAAAMITGTSADAQPPSLSPSGGTGKYAFLSVVCFDAGAAFNAMPSDYQNNHNWLGSSDGASILTAQYFRETNAFAPDPWDTDAEDWVAFSLAILPNAMGPVTISGSADIDAMKDKAYSFTPDVVGGTPPYTFSKPSGTLPPGLSLNSATGAITGTPTTAGTYSGIVIRVTDDDAATDDLAALTITVRKMQLVQVDQRTSNSTVTTHTLTDVDYGDEHSTRIIVVTISAAGVSNLVSAVTISGTSALVGARTTYDRNSAIYYLPVPTGASGTIVVTCSPAASICTTILAIYGVDDVIYDSATLKLTGFATVWNASIDADADGIIVGVLGHADKFTPVDWTNLTELTDIQPSGANQRHSTAYDYATSASTISVTATLGSNSGGVLSLVSFPRRSTSSGNELREDSSIELREDGSKELREVPL